MPTDTAQLPSLHVRPAQLGPDATQPFGATDIQPHYGLQLEILETLSSARHYNDWIASLVFPHLGDDPIEIGSGLGDQAACWLARGAPRLTLSDLESRSVEALGERFGTDGRVSIRQVDLLGCAPGSFSAAVAINVLEHMDDDVAALSGARRLVRPNGRVAVLVPAFPFAMSRFDREIGHYRRYTTHSLRRALGMAGLEPLLVRYVNAPGLVAWVVMMRLLRMRPTGNALVGAWDQVVVPLARRLENRIAVPFGQSVFAVSAPRPRRGARHTWSP